MSAHRRGAIRLVLLPLLTVSVISPAAFAAAAPAALDEKAALATSQAAIGRQLDDYNLIDQHGRVFRLSERRGRPLVISLIYTSCYHTCPATTNHLAQAVEIARAALGQDSFAVLTIGFDTANDTPERMRLFARERGIDVPAWTFASAEAATMARLVEQLGFVYRPSPRGFDHLTQATIIDRDGVIRHQVYGEMIHPPTFVEPLKALVWGVEADPSTFRGWLTGVRLFCTVYDPTTGRYTFDYSIFVGIIIGLLSLGAVAVFIVRAWRQSSAPRKAA